jgi:hypothetical protein
VSLHVIALSDEIRSLCLRQLADFSSLCLARTRASSTISAVRRDAGANREARRASRLLINSSALTSDRGALEDALLEVTFGPWLRPEEESIFSAFRSNNETSELDSPADSRAC